MVTNTNDSKNPASGDFIDIKKYIGVGSVNVVAVNPTNAQLRKYGWSIPEDAQEPEYVSKDKDGKQNTRVRFLVRIEELDKPIIALDFFVRKEFRTSNKDGVVKVQVIDDYGRWAYATQQEFQTKATPQNTNGPANIDTNYRMAHIGEVDLITFILKYLNVTPTEVWDRNLKKYVPTKDPGKLVFDNWDLICNGNVDEIRKLIAMRPNNHVKVVFGIRTTSENKSYQAFIPSQFIGNGASVDMSSGVYISAENVIRKYMAGRSADSPVQLTFSAKPIEEWKVTATEVTDNSEKEEDMPNFDDPEFFKEKEDDLPF